MVYNPLISVLTFRYYNRKYSRDIEITFGYSVHLFRVLGLGSFCYFSLVVCVCVLLDQIMNNNKNRNVN